MWCSNALKDLQKLLNLTIVLYKRTWARRVGVVRIVIVNENLLYQVLISQPSWKVIKLNLPVYFITSPNVQFKLFKYDKQVVFRVSARCPSELYSSEA